MKHGLQLLLIPCLGLLSFRSMGMANNYVSVSCGQEHVVIKSDYAEGLPPLDKSSDFYLQNYGQTNECRLKSGDVVRVRLRFEFNTENYTQQSWVSVWFDRKKWLSGTNVEVTGPDDVRADSIDISADGTRMCTVHGPIFGSGTDGGAEKKETPVCKFVAREQLPKLIDTNEPERLDVSERPLAPPTIPLGKGNPLCKIMAALDQSTVNSGVSLGGHLWLNFPAGHPIRIQQAPGSIGQEWAVSNQVDIDNSGASRHVYYRLQSMGYWENYDIYVVLDDAGYQRFLHTTMTDEDLLKNAETVWPMDWSAHPNRLEANKIIDALAISLSINGNLSEKVDIPDKQARIIPFAYRDQTYLLLSSNQSSEGLGFVVTPHPAGNFDQVCVFRAGVTNF
jgi:hypothetical protein